jgi:beta-phosphoglucomutase-like phosphatase (HAD superfamily)
MSQSKCEVVMFDLDDTLIHKFSDTDKLQDHILDILKLFKINGKKVVLVSLNSYADEVLYTFNIHYLFDKIYFKDWRVDGDHKSDFFCDIHRSFGVPFENMLLFDDNINHLNEAQTYNIKCIKVNPDTLIQWHDINQGLSLFKLK